MKSLAKLTCLLLYFVVVCLGLPCRQCPHGYYGEQCIETCSCGTELCDDVLGCVTPGKQLHEILFDIITLLNCIEINIFQLVKSSILTKIWHTVIVFMYF